MNLGHIKTSGIVVARVQYGEADRIVTVLTPDQGKVGLMAKGARRAKSKLAGGIELFSVSEIVFMRGKRGLGTLVSARLERHFSGITASLDRTMLGYELLKNIQKITEDDVEEGYYRMLLRALAGLDDPAVPLELVRVWFAAQLLALGGHSPNLTTTREGEKLRADETFDFDFDSMALYRREEGVFGVSEIKFSRLLLEGRALRSLADIHGAEHMLERVAPAFIAMRQLHLGV